MARFKNPTTLPVLFVITCFVIWGTFPIYWKQLHHVPALEVLSHRMIWSFLFYLGIFQFSRLKHGATALKTNARDWKLATVSAALLIINWGVYIYAVNAGHILEGSLAYFINPLMSVALGVLVFKEDLPRLLKIAFALACAGVLVRIAYGQHFPWIALILATSFCIYGAVKKVTRTPATQSSLMEGLMGLAPSLIAAIYLRQTSDFTLTTSDWAYLVGSGVVTGLPLFLFAIAAQRLPLSLIGMLQFIGPTLQFLVGVYMYGETLTQADLFSFMLIWGGVGFYFADKLRRLASHTPEPQKPLDVVEEVTN